MNYMERYNAWLNEPTLDAELKAELLAIKDNEDEIRERFTTELEFGTAGLRGVIAAGTARMNIYTVARATQGIAAYLKEIKENPSVIIGYDCRIKSDVFAINTACIFAANGIHVYLYDELKPVPMVSFGVRELSCDGGVMITASHNPAKYNGYKLYGNDGCQIGAEVADVVLAKIADIDYFGGVKTMDFEEAKKTGMITMIGEEMEEKFLDVVQTQLIDPEVARRMAKDLQLVYTPFHGTGNKPVRKILARMGLTGVIPVKEQTEPDGTFPTVKSPNPEDKEGFAIAIEMAKKDNIDMILGTDPDCDRVGVVVRTTEGEYIALTGNQIGCLLTDYVLSRRIALGTMPEKPFVIKSIVTSNLTDRICESYGVTLYQCLTGFKHIGEVIYNKDDMGDESYVFGFEESYGYLAGTHARDKDGVVASMLIAEMTAYYMEQGLTLYDALQNLFKKHGYFREGVMNIYREGLDGAAEIKQMMKNAREKKPTTIGGRKVLALRDYQAGTRVDFVTGVTGEAGLGKSNVLYYELENNEWAVIRPSGTEPKLKIYCSVSGATEAEANAHAEATLNDMNALLAD